MRKLFLSLLLCFVGTAVSFAEDWTDENGIVWHYTDVDGGVQLDGASNYGESFAIPSKINGKDIKIIDSYAFYGCSSLVNISDLSTCTSIGNGAFNGCSSLVSIGDLRACTSIGNGAFWGCSSLVSMGDLSACTYIDNDAFRDCSSLVSIGDLSACATIGVGVFVDCSSLTSIGNLNACKSIGQIAFSGCSSLMSIGDLSACTSIGSQAFARCTSLKCIGNLSACLTIDDYAFSGCHRLTNIGNLSACKTIGESAFNYCSSLTSVGDLSACASIGRMAFNGCTSLTNIGDLSACKFIGVQAFLGCKIVKINFNNSTPPTMESGNFVNDLTTVIVPADALEAYRTAENWSELAVRIIPDNVRLDYTGENKVIVTAQDKASGLQNAIGEENLQYVMNLELEGTINSYDIFVIRNKMPNLHVLDLTNTQVLESSYPYYESYMTRNDVLGDYAFNEQAKLVEVKLPKTITRLGQYAFSNASNLVSITLYEGLEQIDDYAFYNCNLQEVTIPEGVLRLGDCAFDQNFNLQKVSLPNTLGSIARYTFRDCKKIENITLPDGLESIGEYAFNGCNALSELIIPGSIKTIGDYAFEYCPALKTVKSKLVDPFTIGQSTFSTWTTATLYVPMTEEWNATYNKYYWDTQWGQFAHIQGWDPSIPNFYLDNDYELNSGTIGNEEVIPDADFNAGSGFIVDGSGSQNLDEVHVKQDGDMGASIIDNNDRVNINTLYSDIKVGSNRWYFFCFPFDVTLSEISAPGNYVFRYYDGKERATNGRGGWKNLPKDMTKLDAGIGYIFQTDTEGVLSIPVSNPDFQAMAKNQKALVTNAANNKQDASWNFVGNPYLSYYSIEDLTSFDAPLTIWNGSSYEAVRPGDDDFLLQPFQAFFVQKPSANDYMGFNAASQTTYTKGNKKMNKAKARRATAQVNPERMLVNLTISDGENTDKTRVVFNDRHQMDYEMECDAAKFLADGNVPQLYTIYKNVNYAINERPNGNREVQLGFSTKKAGEFTIAAVRMDTPMLLKDAKLGVTFDLRIGSYTFQAEAGTFNDRFMLIGANEADKIQGVDVDADNSPVYDLNGRLMEKAQKGVQIVNGKKVLVK